MDVVSDATGRAVRALLALEIQRILHDVEERRALLVRLWGIYRHRQPALDAGFSRWQTLRARELDALRPELVVALDRFYVELDDWHRWAATTQEMPLHLDEHWGRRADRLHAAGTEALALLGPPPAPEPPEADRDGAPLLEGLLPRKKDVLPRSPSGEE